MKDMHKDKYLRSLPLWKQQNMNLIKTIEEFHQLLKEQNSDFDIVEEFGFGVDSLIDKDEVDFVKLLKRLNEIIAYLENNQDKVIKREILQKICKSYYDIYGIGTLRFDRIFDSATNDQQYNHSYNVILQFLSRIEYLINKFKANIVQEKEFIYICYKT